MTDDMNRAADAVAALDTQAAITEADALAAAFEAAGERIAGSLESAARRGELSFSDMAEAVLKDLARLPVGELVEGPLTALVTGLTGALQGAGGGGKASPNIVMNVSGVADASGFQRSESQITASLARVAQSGARRIG